MFFHTAFLIIKMLSNELMIESKGNLDPVNVTTPHILNKCIPHACVFGH